MKVFEFRTIATPYATTTSHATITPYATITPNSIVKLIYLYYKYLIVVHGGDILLCSSPH